MKRGFTLIELLISIVLMMILMFAMMTIFVRTTDVVSIQDARTTVFTNARYALDIMQRDLAGTLSVNPPPLQAGGPTNPGGRPPQQNQNQPQAFEQVQAFWMENGVSSAPGREPAYNASGGHHDHAGDRMAFRTTTAVGDSMQTCEVTYKLIPASMTIDQQGSLQSGDDSHRETVRTRRALFTLIRAVRTADPASDPPQFTQIPKVMDRVTGAMANLVDMEVCHYVISFNLEYFANNQSFSQLDPSPFPSSDPLGDGLGDNDVANPYTVPAIRVTLVIVEDVAERCERTVQRVIWIPAN